MVPCLAVGGGGQGTGLHPPKARALNGPLPGGGGQGAGLHPPKARALNGPLPGGGGQGAGRPGPCLAVGGRERVSTLARALNGPLPGGGGQGAGRPGRGRPGRRVVLLGTCPHHLLPLVFLDARLVPKRPPPPPVVDPQDERLGQVARVLVQVRLDEARHTLRQHLEVYVLVDERRLRRHLGGGEAGLGQVAGLLLSPHLTQATLLLDGKEHGQLVQSLLLAGRQRR